MKNLNVFRKIPSGCAEQRLKGFVPNVVALNYLNATKKLTSQKKKEGEEALRIGVEQALETRISEGSKIGAFSIWGTESRGPWARTARDPSDSIWLTAYVAKCFGKAKHWFSLQDKYLSDALEFLKRHQNETGKFPEYGPISYYNLQTESSVGIPLTAFTVIAFLEQDKLYIERFNETIFKALDYIDTNVASIKDNYALAIATYALALGKHDAAGKLLEQLIDGAILDGDKMYWEKEMGAKKRTGKTSESTKIEMAAYAILAYVELGKALDAVPIVNWLISRRNSGGGFSSTHDTGRYGNLLSVRIGTN